MHKETLTDDLIEKLPQPERERSVYDYEVAGLYVRVRPSGHKSFMFRPREGFRRKAVLIGTFPAITVQQARARSEDHLTAVLNGFAPSSRSPTSSQLTFGQACPRYFSQMRGSQEWIERTERTWRLKLLPMLAHVRLRDLTSDLVEKATSHSQNSYARRETRYVLSAMMAWAVRNNFLPRNVVHDRRPPPRPFPRPKRRTRLSRGGLAAIWRACDALPEPWKTIHQATILTAMPIPRILSLTTLDVNNRWAYSDEVERPSTLAHELLEIAAQGRWGLIFARRGADRPLVYQQRWLNVLREESGISDFTMRDVQQSIFDNSPPRGTGRRAWDVLLQAATEELDQPLASDDDIEL